MEIQPEARFTMAAGMKKGLMRDGPRSMRMVCSRSMVAKPPMPLPMYTPTISSLPASTFSPESFRAKSAAATANWMKRSIFLTSFFSTQRRGSKPFTSQAKRDECCEASNSVMGPAPDRPAWRDFQVSSVPIPTGDTRPTPVTTTLRSAATVIWSLLRSRSGRPLLLGLVRVLVDVLGGFLDARDLLGVLVRDLDPELLLQRHHQLHRVQAVRAQVVHEGGVGSDEVLLD